MLRTSVGAKFIFYHNINEIIGIVFNVFHTVSSCESDNYPPKLMCLMDAELRKYLLIKLLI